jgi:hypothetical protein
MRARLLLRRNVRLKAGLNLFVTLTIGDDLMVFRAMAFADLASHKTAVSNQGVAAHRQTGGGVFQSHNAACFAEG